MKRTLMLISAPFALVGAAALFLFCLILPKRTTLKIADFLVRLGNFYEVKK